MRTLNFAMGVIVATAGASLFYLALAVVVSYWTLAWPLLVVSILSALTFLCGVSLAMRQFK